MRKESKTLTITIPGLHNGKETSKKKKPPTWTRRMIVCQYWIPFRYAFIAFVIELTLSRKLNMGASYQAWEKCLQFLCWDRVKPETPVSYARKWSAMKRTLNANTSALTFEGIPLGITVWDRQGWDGQLCSSGLSRVYAWLLILQFEVGTIFEVD